MACTDPQVHEAVRITGHSRLLEQLDPEHADYAPGLMDLVKRIVSGEIPFPSEPRSDPPPFAPLGVSSDGRLRVGFWCPVLNLGGAEDWQLSLAKALDPTRIDIQGVAVRAGGIDVHPQMVAQFAALMPVSYGEEGLASLAARCDVIVQWAIDGCERLLSRLARKPVVVAVSHSPEESTWAKHIYSDPRGIDAFVAVSTLAIPPIPEGFRDKAAVIWNAVDGLRMTPARTRAEMLAQWGLPEGSKVLGYIGRLEDDKDPHALARAIVHLPAEWHAVVVGEGHDQFALEAAARENPRVHLVGGDRDAGSVVNAFDVQVVPSAYESFGLSLCEGLWSGVPVISTKVGVCKLEPGLTREIHVKPTGEQLALAVHQDLYDREGTASRVERAKAFARERLTMARFGREWTNYLTGLGRRRSEVRHTLDCIKLARECPERVTDGSCQKARCKLGRGNAGVVFLSDCLECPRVTQWPVLSPHPFQEAKS